MAEQILKDLTFFYPELALTATFLAAILADLIFKRTAIVVSTVVMAGFVVTGVMVLAQVNMHESIFGNMIAVDSFAYFFKLVIIISAILIVVFSLGSSELNTPRRRLGEYYSLLSALTLGMMLMAGASNLLMMYLSVELSSIASYILSGYTKDAPDSSEASLKYVIYGALSSGLMLYGISIVYGLTGSLDIYAINQTLAKGEINSIALLIAGVLTMAGFGYKISAVPFHFWTPDVYEGAPITITAFLSVASKAGAFAMMIRFFKVTFIDSSVVSLPAGVWATFQGFQWYHLIAVLSVLTMTLGNLVAIWQNNLKRLLAYSSIAHAGYMLMGVVVLSNEGLAAILVYFVVYLFMNLGAFYIVMLVANKTGSEDIEDYKGLGSRAPFIALALSVFLISLTGLPPTAGFIGKLYLFAALLNHGWVWLAVVGALNSVISLYYYVRIFRNMYLRSGEPQGEPISFGWVSSATVLVLLIPTILLGLYFTPLVQLAQASVRMFGIP
ncbi:MAG: NADH-quinone oxidoreductase subunit N [Ignavibacteriae bacterium]|nr:NADH-quinone oxidoreductase subunit N [Ignavibacteriota bacterium]